MISKQNHGCLDWISAYMLFQTFGFLALTFGLCFHGGDLKAPVATPWASPTHKSSIRALTKSGRTFSSTAVPEAFPWQQWVISSHNQRPDGRCSTCSQATDLDELLEAWQDAWHDPSAPWWLQRVMRVLSGCLMNFQDQSHFVNPTQPSTASHNGGT